MGVLPDHGVAFTRNILECRAVEDLDVTATVRALQTLRPRPKIRSAFRSRSDIRSHARRRYRLICGDARDRAVFVLMGDQRADRLLVGNRAAKARFERIDPRNKKPDFNAGLLHFRLAANYFAGVIFAT
jgi:hypothetical protein